MASGAPPVVPIPPFIAKLTGPLLLGHLFNWGLYGCLAVQCYIYYLSFPKDRLLPKSLVIAAITIETLQTILSTRDAFRNFGTGWGDMIDLDAVGWLWFSVPVLGSVITSMAQMFFAWRIYILSKKLYLPILVALISTVQCIFGLWGGIYAHILGRFSEVQSHAYRITSVWLGGTALCDIIIAISMMFYLTRSRTGFRTTNILITKIIRVTVETGFICAAFAILDLAFFLRWQDNNYHLAPSIALSKLYANSLLVVLNARVRIVGGRDSSNGVEQHRSTASSSHLSSNGLQSRPKPPRPSVNMVHMSSYGQEDSDIPMTDAKPKIQRLEVNIEEEREVYRYPEEEEDRDREYRYQRKSGTLV